MLDLCLAIHKASAQHNTTARATGQATFIFRVEPANHWTDRLQIRLVLHIFGCPSLNVGPTRTADNLLRTLRLSWMTWNLCPCKICDAWDHDRVFSCTQYMVQGVSACTLTCRYISVSNTACITTHDMDCTSVCIMVFLLVFAMLLRNMITMMTWADKAP